MSMTIELPDPRDDVAKHVSEIWLKLNNERQALLSEWADIRSYVTSTTTDDTEVGQLPWKNKTRLPKLTQIRENLAAYYMAALFPTEDWLRFEGRDVESHEKANWIEEYVLTKTRMGGYRPEKEKCIYDWIDFGCYFAGIKWVHEKIKSFVTGEEITNYVGPKLFRISPMDCCIDPRASSFEDSPFIWRKMMSIANFIEKYPELKDKVLELRGSSNRDTTDWYKENGFRIDGFTSFDQYLNSGYIELIEYWGDIFITNTQEVLKNRKIVIADRSFTVENIDNPSWNGKKPFSFVPWRNLPENLYGQSPLANLIGMQYRCDHLENLKADTWDQFVHPMVIIKGDEEEDFEWRPGGKHYLPIDGSVEVLRPDGTVLQANNSEIQLYFQMMEQFAGSPREAMGMRTPGEKTAFEVSVLAQGADRFFQNKLNKLEELGTTVELNLMYEMLVRNMDIADIARTFNDDEKSLILTTLTKEDVVADGVIHPIGAKHYAARNQRVQELSNMVAALQNPQVAPHISGYKFAKAIEEELGFEKYGVVEKDVAVKEQITTQLTAQQLQQQAQQVMGPQAEGGITVEPEEI